MRFGRISVDDGNLAAFSLTNDTSFVVKLAVSPIKTIMLAANNSFPLVLLRTPWRE